MAAIWGARDRQLLRLHALASLASPVEQSLGRNVFETVLNVCWSSPQAQCTSADRAQLEALLVRRNAHAMCAKNMVRAARRREKVSQAPANADWPTKPRRRWKSPKQAVWNRPTATRLREATVAKGVPGHNGLPAPSLRLCRLNFSIVCSRRLKVVRIVLFVARVKRTPRRYNITHVAVS